jgi:hypothetical protein
MRTTGTSVPSALMLLVLVIAGSALWTLHATAWDLGRRSPVLNYDTSQYALAARELATHGRLATTFALPLELAKHPTPPWPLAVVQPGLVMVEALTLKLLPVTTSDEGRHGGRWARPDQQERPLLTFPFVCFAMVAITLGLGAKHVLRVESPGASRWLGAGAGIVIGLAFLLDPEAQHFAVGPFTELPFTFGLAGAVAALALGRASSSPLVFGLLLGLTGAFRANMLWFAPVLALGAAWAAPSRRLRVALLVMIGYCVPLAPWWFYKWRVFGSPGWDLSRYVIWDGVGGNTWFSIYHHPAPGELPQGLVAFDLLSRKVMRNLPNLVLATLTGPRALWVAALFAWAFVVRGSRERVAAGCCVIAIGGLSLVQAAVSIPWLRYVFPARVLTEAAGILACWGLLARMSAPAVAPALRRVAVVFVALLAIGWGAFQTSLGLVEARKASAERGSPSTLSMLKLAVLMNREIPPGEPVMSNLGPELAWHARRPVIHLSLRPEDMSACRQRTEFRHVILVFRDPSKAWPGWQELVAHPIEASRDPDLHIERARQLDSGDGFTIAWFELGPPEPRLAGGEPARGSALALAAPAR